MGLRSAAYCCQEVTNLVTFVHTCLQYWSINYLDDFGGAETPEVAWESFQCLGKILMIMGIDKAIGKSIAPTTRMEFLGNVFDVMKMTIEISQECMAEILQLLDSWLTKTSASRTELESLIGKLSFIANCVRAGRVFICRLLNTLSGFPMTGIHKLHSQIRKDLLWWKLFMQDYNGISILWLQDVLPPDHFLSTDSCLKGAGGMCGQEYFHIKYPDFITRKYKNIAHLEMLAIIIAVKLWYKKLQGKVIHLFCDNIACVQVINAGRKMNYYKNASEV